MDKVDLILLCVGAAIVIALLMFSKNDGGHDG